MGVIKMIKYFDVDSFDESGINIIPVVKRGLTKTASSYSPELMEVIMGMKRDPAYYYVVINALGAFERWGANKNGDGFPESGLKHFSTAQDMGSENDFGYKTFELYAKLFKHHVNKSDSPSYGKVFHSHWNDAIKRVELIVGIDRTSGADIIDALERDEVVSVSMGARVKHDLCNICGNMASTRAQYCTHLKNYLRHIVSAETARKWSLETGRLIQPGTMVHAINDKPKFFDISRVHVGADRTAFVLGKAASTAHGPSGLDLAEAYGMTDTISDELEKKARLSKISQIRKVSEIDKEVGGPGEIDGAVIKDDTLHKVLSGKMLNLIESEPRLPTETLNSLAMSGSLKEVLSNMLGIGIHPKPVEFQRIVLVNIGERDLADQLESQRMVFDNNAPCGCTQLDMPEPNNDFILRMLSKYISSRSSAIPALMSRMNAPVEKTASVMDAMKLLKGEIAQYMAGLYAGMKMKAAGTSAQVTASLFERKPWLLPVIGGGVYATLMRTIADSDKTDKTLIPAYAYTGSLKPGFQKQASMGNAVGLGLAAGALALPAAYVMNTYNQKSLYEKGVPLFAGAGTDPKTSAILAGGGTLTGTLLYDRLKGKLGKIV
jgi:hypothetical protein